MWLDGSNRRFVGSLSGLLGELILANVGAKMRSWELELDAWECNIEWWVGD